MSTVETTYPIPCRDYRSYLTCSHYLRAVHVIGLRERLDQNLNCALVSVNLTDLTILDSYRLPFARSRSITMPETPIKALPLRVVLCQGCFEEAGALSTRLCHLRLTRKRCRAALQPLLAYALGTLPYLELAEVVPTMGDMGDNLDLPCQRKLCF